MLGSLPANAAEPVAEFQTFLADRACDVGAVDGQWGRRTSAAANLIAEASGIAIERPVTLELISALSATDARCPARFIPLTSLPHPGEFFFSLDEVRGRTTAEAAFCDSPYRGGLPPFEEPAIQVGWESGGDTAVQGNHFAADLMAATGYLMRGRPGVPEPTAHVAQSRDRLVAWAKADAMRNFEIDNGSHWWAVWQAFPAFLLAYDTFNREGMLTEDEANSIEGWLVKLMRRTYLGQELPISGPYEPNDERINNKNIRRNLISLLWAVETNDVALFNQSVESGYLRFLEMMGEAGNVSDNNRGNWALQYGALHLSAAVMFAEAAMHQGVDLYSLELDGKSLHRAVTFFLDANGDPALIDQFARENAGMSDKVGGLDQYAGEQDPGWKTQTDYGISYIGWAEAYIKRFPGTDNSRRLSTLIDGLMDAAGYQHLMDWSFGNVSCFWGDPERAAKLPELRKAASLEVGSVIIQDFDQWDEGANFSVMPFGVKLDGESVSIRPFQVFAEFIGSPDRMRRFQLLFYVNELQDEESQTADYMPCSVFTREMRDNGKFQIAFQMGFDEPANACLLERLGENDQRNIEALLGGFDQFLAATGSAEGAAILRDIYAKLPD
ncbi:MAG: alginate lyase family protein [Cucumibacter sp.]